MIIAIDGPAGSGKSTVAKIAAHNLGFQYLDTGAMYRAVALMALRRSVSLEGCSELIAIARDEPIEFGTFGGGSVSIGGVDVTDDIRTREVDHAVSPVSACPEVRAALVDQQRAIAASNDIVMEGRDIGTVVFPDADLKIFLTASPEARAHRRSEQNIVRGIGDTDENLLLDALAKRDEYDSMRKTAPLRPAEDAVMLDTSELSIDEVVRRIVDLALSRKNAAGFRQEGR